MGSACGWGGASCSPRGTSSVTYSIGPHGRGCARARGATIGRGARGRRTRKNARAPRKGRLPSLARPRGQFRRAKPRAAGRGLARPVVRVAVEAGVEAGVAASVHALARAPRDSTGFGRYTKHGWRLTTSRLTLSKRRLRLCAGSALGRDRRATPRCSAAPWCSRRPTCASTTLTTCATATSPRRAWRRSRPRTQAITRCAGLPRDASPSDARRGRLCMYGVTGRAVAAPSSPPSRAAHSGVAPLTA